MNTTAADSKGTGTETAGEQGDDSRKNTKNFKNFMFQIARNGMRCYNIGIRFDNQR